MKRTRSHTEKLTAAADNDEHRRNVYRNMLNNYCLIEIFKRLPLFDRLQVDKGSVSIELETVIK